MITPEAGVAPEIAPWLWALADARRRTLAALDGVTQAALDRQPPDGGNGIGTILYHIALIEADWLYAEVLEAPETPGLQALFPYPDRDERGRLTPMIGRSLADHLALLDTTRALLRAAFRPMTAADFHRPRHLPAYDVTPAWVLHHLLQHEAEHRGELGLRREGTEEDD